MGNLPYGIIGNCQISALVHQQGSIDWACFPRFDSPSTFAKILDEQIGGSFSILPEGNFRSKQYYLRNTNILITEYDCGEEGQYELIDFAPRFKMHERYFKPTSIYRIVRLKKGSPRIIVNCDPNFDYARQEAEIKIGSNHIDYNQDLRLTCTAPLTYVLENRPFKLEQDQYFVLTHGEPLEASLKFTCEEYLEKTKTYWQTWVKHLNIPKVYQDESIRSALILKLHYFNDTGAMVAATTTSIPESDGSVRNWDYRYCWLRDAYFVIQALDSLGQFTEKEKFVSYLSNLLHSDIQTGLQPVYGISGEKKLIEQELDHLQGFRGNKPVRVGNDAHTHEQYDIYGEMVLSLAPIFFDRRLVYDLDKLFVDFRLLVEKSIDLFQKPDASIWEFRSDGGIHTYSQIFCWAAADKGAAVAKHLGYLELSDKWQQKSQEMKKIILDAAWNEKRQMFTQRFHDDNADASNLLMQRLGIVDAKDPKFKSTVEQYGKILRKGNHMYRYVNEDDFGFPKTSFNICTFWYIDALIAIGEIKEATRLYENILSKTNHVGILSEDIDAETGELWGNFPQTYSHVGIINIAKRLEE